MVLVTSTRWRQTMFMARINFCPPRKRYILTCTEAESDSRIQNTRKKQGKGFMGHCLPFRLKVAGSLVITKSPGWVRRVVSVPVIPMPLYSVSLG